MKNSSKFQAGDIVLIAYPFTDLKGRKIRPALVIRDQKDEDLLLAPISTTVHRTQNDTLLKEEDYEGIALPVLSCLRNEKLFTLSGELVLKKVSSLKKKVMTSIRQKISAFIVQD